MARRKTTPTPADTPVTDYRHADKRKNIPPAGLAAPVGYRGQAEAG